MSTVALSGGVDQEVGRYVHNETDEWMLTSDYPVEHLHGCSEASVYNELLPGRLGMFVYPLDVRFHVKNRQRTTRTDFDAVVRAERTLLKREQTLNTQSLTIAQETYDAESEFVPNEEKMADRESSADEDDVDEDEEDAENEPHDAIDEDCIDSDDEQQEA